MDGATRDRRWLVMRFDIRRQGGMWALTLRTSSGWWGLCRVPGAVYLDLGLVRISRRGKWTPLFAEPRAFGPIQWWRF